MADTTPIQLPKNKDGSAVIPELEPEVKPKVGDTVAPLPYVIKDTPVDFAKCEAKLNSFYKSQMEYAGKNDHNPFIGLGEHEYFTLKIACDNKTLSPAQASKIAALDDKFVPKLSNLKIVSVLQ